MGSGEYNATDFTTACVELATNVTARYGEATAMFFACGPMSNAYCAAVTECLDQLAVNAGNPGFPTATYFLDQTDLEVEMDCCGHPTASDDALMASAAADFISVKLDWAARVPVQPATMSQ